MDDETCHAPTCGNCGLPIRDGEAVDWTPFPPKRLCHATHADCFARLRADLAAALVVVLAARVLRVRAWQCDRAARRLNRAHGDDTILAYDAAYRAGRDAARAHRAALAAYVKGEGR